MDTVIHDGAPNVGGAWASEAYSQSWLVLESLKLACEFLAPRGTFVTKIFRCTQCFLVDSKSPSWGRGTANRRLLAGSCMADCCWTNSSA